MRTMMPLVLGLLLAGMGAARAAETLPATDPRLEYSDCDQVVPGDDGTARFERSVLHDRKYHLDNPGARLRFRCDAKTIAVELRYSRRDDPKRAQNGVGVYLVDGKGRAEWIFRRPKAGDQPETVTVELPADGALHDYELVMPYGDIVAVAGVTVPEGTKFGKPSARPKFRAVFFGDSVTHGFDASRIDRTWPYRVGERNGYEVVNLALGGIALVPAQAETVGRQKADLFVIAAGVNNWQGGASLDSVKRQTAGFLAELRKAHPDTPIAVVTPLWVPPEWTAKTKATADLAEYRRVIAEAARESGGRILVIDGEGLIDHDGKLFNPGAQVHPLDAGFEQMAERAGAALEKWLK